jgi:hypothetical protein
MKRLDKDTGKYRRYIDTETKTSANSNEKRKHKLVIVNATALKTSDYDSELKEIWAKKVSKDTSGVLLVWRILASLRVADRCNSIVL